MADDSIALQGAPNFRDLGGLTAGEGMRVRTGLIYRSEALHALTDRDLDRLGELEVALVCDLRTPGERQRSPSRWREGLRPETIELDGERDGTATVEGAYGLIEQRISEAAQAYMRNAYTGYPRVYAPVIADLAKRIIAGRVPLVVHCHAGKDRTGFVCAMLLYALGVERETVEADYLRSDSFFGRERISAAASEWLGREPDAELVDVFRSQLPYLELSIAEVEREHGSIEKYLEAAAGIDTNRRAILRELLLEPVS